MIPDKEQLIKELNFKTSRSGGKGGQNVNKVSTKVELIFNISASLLFSEEQKVILSEKLIKRLDSEGNLHIISQDDRSQLLNKQRTVLKLYTLLKKSLEVPKKRKATKVPRAVVQKRLTNKLVTSSRKQTRKKPDLD